MMSEIFYGLTIVSIVLFWANSTAILGYNSKQGDYNVNTTLKLESIAIFVERLGIIFVEVIIMLLLFLLIGCVGNIILDFDTIFIITVVSKILFIVSLGVIMLYFKTVDKGDGKIKLLLVSEIISSAVLGVTLLIYSMEVISEVKLLTTFDIIGISAYPTMVLLFIVLIRLFNVGKGVKYPKVIIKIKPENLEIFDDCDIACCYKKTKSNMPLLEMQYCKADKNEYFFKRKGSNRSVGVKKEYIESIRKE